MLHEVLLALSGHPSPLFTPQEQNGDKQSWPSADFPLLSPSERALLQSLRELSELHRRLRQHAQVITSSHGSTICRAVALSILHTHLSRFQKKILDVESKILTNDAALVGAYHIVPLASIVTEFDDWQRRMVWYWEIASFMQSESSPRSCSGAMLIDKLRAESSTGFPEIAEAAVELSMVAETAWLKQLASWILYGKLPSHGAQDFFIRIDPTGVSQDMAFSREQSMLPAFVSPSTATSMLFIGRSLHQIRQYKDQARGQTKPQLSMDEAHLARIHLEYFSALSLPIQAPRLSQAVSAIRQSVSQNALQHLLPMELTMQTLDCLRQYFLLAKGEFAVALIDQADRRLQRRQQSMGRSLQQDPVRAMQSLSIKDAELHQVMQQTWKALSRDNDDDVVSTSDFARKHILLAAPTAIASRPSTSDSMSDNTPQLLTVAFNDLLLPNATCLDMNIESPLELFITPREIQTYSTINAFLLSIRRAEIHLSELWHRSAARRDHPSPSTREARQTPPSVESKARIKGRRKAARKVWATCSAALFLISETAAFLEGEVVQSSCAHFADWVRTPIVADVGAASEEMCHRDPETLSSAHRAFLASLSYALLLTDVPYTRELRSLLGNIDALIAFFGRLLDLQTRLDIELEGLEAPSALAVEEEQRVSLDLDRARKKVDSDLRSVVDRLRRLDQERVGSARYRDLRGGETGGYEAWKGGGVDRLLMKLEFGRGSELPSYVCLGRQ